MYQEQTLVGDPNDHRIQRLLRHGSCLEESIGVPWICHSGIHIVENFSGQ
jgi:hypothetical protein